MINLLRDVMTFHEKFGIDYDGPPRVLPPGLWQFRVNFIREELKEYEEAADAGDLPKMLDALLDLIYVAVGTAILHGFRSIFSAAWDRVQDANMVKERATAGTEGKRPWEFDIVKPPDWEPPTFDDLLRAARGTSVEAVTEIGEPRTVIEVVDTEYTDVGIEEFEPRRGFFKPFDGDDS